jgi:hypothetical protein
LLLFENEMLRWVSGRRREKVTGRFRQFDSEELSYSHSVPNLVLKFISGRMRWTGWSTLVGNLQRRD